VFTEEIDPEHPILHDGSQRKQAVEPVFGQIKQARGPPVPVAERGESAGRVGL